MKRVLAFLMALFMAFSNIGVGLVEEVPYENYEAEIPIVENVEEPQEEDYIEKILTSELEAIENLEEEIIEEKQEIIEEEQEIVEEKSQEEEIIEEIPQDKEKPQEEIIEENKQEPEENITIDMPEENVNVEEELNVNIDTQNVEEEIIEEPDFTIEIPERYCYITSSIDENETVYSGQELTFTLHLVNFETQNYTIRWQYSENGIDFFDIEGEHNLTYTFNINRANSNYYYRALVNVEE